MKRILIWIALVTFAIGAAVVVFWPVSNWRLYDENWNPLALTEAESWCAGEILARNKFANKRDDPQVDACVVNSSKNNTVPDVVKAQGWQCSAMVSVVPEWGYDNCLATLQSYKIWLLQHGGYTMDWNTSNPYPDIVQYNISQAPRGERDGEQRNEGGRLSG